MEPTIPPKSETKTASRRNWSGFRAGGAEGLADSDLANAGAHVGQHDVHDADAAHGQRDGGDEKEDDCERVCDVSGNGEVFGEGLGLVDGVRPVARLDDAPISLDASVTSIDVAHGEVNLLHLLGANEVARDGVGDENGLIGDLGVAHVVQALFEDADDREGNAADLKGVAHGSASVPNIARAKFWVTTAT